MSSVIFQPLLHDPLGWKASKSTYADHYKWRKYRSASKSKRSSMPNIPLPVTTSEQKTVEPIVLADEKREKARAKTATCRSSSAKNVSESRQRPASANEPVISSSSSSMAQTQVVTVEEKTPTIKEKKQVDANNDNTRHWLTYPNPKTPEYLLEIKKRLGKYKEPIVAPTVDNNPSETVSPATPNRPSSASSQKRQKNNDDSHQFLSFERRETPESLRAARLRLDKHRYNLSLDNYPPRSSEPSIPMIENGQVPPKTPVKTDAWTTEEEQQPKPNPFEQDSQASFIVQYVDCDNLPPEYAEALRTANAAQEEYQRTLQSTNDRRIEISTPYRLPVENQTDSVLAYKQQQPPPSPSTMNNNNTFGNWVRNASEKERASAMKLLQEVLNQPIMGYDIPTKKKNHSKQAPAPPPVRASSATRKLGRTRNQHRFPCEICEKLLIKRHVWDLSRPETDSCPHQPGRISVRT